MKLDLCGDKELWLIKRDGWCLPIHCAPCFDPETREVYVMVTPALLPTDPQQEALHKVFRQHSISLAEDSWIIPSGTISALAEHATGVTAEFYYEWFKPGEKEKKPEPETFEVTIKQQKSSGDDFMKFLFHERPEINTAQFRSMWHMIHIYGAEWIYKHQRTLDLGFVRLDALPYRANWKQLFLSRFPGCQRIFKMRIDERIATLKMALHASSFIRGSWMIRMNPRKHCAHWTIEATQSKEWDDYVEKNESHRFNTKGKHAYLSWWRSAVNKLENKIYDILTEYVRATAAPCAGIGPSDELGRTALVPHVTMGRILPALEGHLQTAIVSPDPTDEMASYGQLGEVEFPNEPLPKVPVLRLPTEDVRDTGRVHGSSAS